MSLSSTVAKKAKRCFEEKQICALGDADLSAIFERLPPYDRLTISEVCRRWNKLSRKAWLDVTELNLSPIPGKHIGAVVRQCPNLQSVLALKKSFGVSELAILSRASKLSVVKLYDCSFAVKGDLNDSVDAPNDVLAKMFSENLRHASFRELILHDARIEDKSIPAGSNCQSKWALAASFLPASLTRLQLSHLCFMQGILDDTWVLLNGLDHLQDLECLILHGTPLDRFYDNDNLLTFGLVYPSIVNRLCALKHLRELCIGPAWPFTYNHRLERLIASLPKLEVLFLSDVDACGDIAEDLAELVTKNSVLRILVLADQFYRPFSDVEIIDLTARKHFPHGFGSDPLPILHIFLGEDASERIRFATSPSDAAIIHPINEPMPRFLEREDIAPIFEGVWVAEKIKETAKLGGELWSYEQHDRATAVKRTVV